MIQGLRRLYSDSGLLVPYVDGLFVLGDRFLWDANPKSWASTRALARMRGRHAGEKAVVLCNGPSLNRVDFDLLKGVYTYGLNKINLMFDKTKFRPSCVVSVNKAVLKQNSEFYNRTNIPLFLDRAGAKWVRSRDNVVFMHSTIGGGRVASNCTASLVQGYTVTVVALQLALHMGFSEVALVGCDHNFSDKGRPNSTVRGGAVDENHFHPDYFANKEWQLPDLVGSEFYYSRVGLEFEKRGVRLVNATVGGKLELFERQSLAEFVG